MGEEGVGRRPPVVTRGSPRGRGSPRRHGGDRRAAARPRQRPAAPPRHRPVAERVRSRRPAAPTAVPAPVAARGVTPRPRRPVSTGADGPPRDGRNGTGARVAARHRRRRRRPEASGSGSRPAPSPAALNNCGTVEPRPTAISVPSGRGGRPGPGVSHSAPLVPSRSPSPIAPRARVSADGAWAADGNRSPGLLPTPHPGPGGTRAAPHRPPPPAGHGTPHRAPASRVPRRHPARTAAAALSPPRSPW
jgi:hypothetical protein